MTDESVDSAESDQAERIERTERTEQSADVVIVGAGPAGAVLGYLLARSGVETVLIERQRTLDREFRGYGFRPPLPRLFAEMDLLDAIEDLPHEVITQGTVVAYGKSYPVFDFDERYVLLLKQPPLLRLLIERAREYDTFTFHSGTTFDGFLREDGSVAGISATSRPSGETLEIRSRLVVGADGRFSSTRKVAGIDSGMNETGIEVVWFRLPCAAADFTTHIRVEDEGVLVYSPLSERESQYGLLIPKGTYPALRDRGIADFRETVSAIEPALDGDIDEHLTSFDACSLLSIRSGLAERWTDDGFLLIGDAAHVASPIGAEGNNLAIQDALAVHRLLTPVLHRGDGPLPERLLRRVEQVRRPAVEETIRAQQSRGDGLSSLLSSRDRIPDALEPTLLRGGAALMSLLARLPSRSSTDENETSVDRTLFVD
ncbi:FAD-dependent monooxygenase [Haladaptatus sp. AB618]|uniref:FAD-dependent monooxygenase n=1 Tax=Haladaptatus sp. AB618 TaxID=2934173 RepID=UPI00209C6B0E|nr:FAD-dependent monooxygenase [Haladaptatus sp. AB618]MCO8255206.1 FAD-dependent monooxygenase [Haladaptatus sp. AB618]